MPFDEEDDEQNLQPRVGLKKLSSQKSIFESVVKKPTQEDLNNNVKKVQERESSHKRRAADLALKFQGVMTDKTLPQNKTIFQKELEIETLKDMVNFASDVNNDPSETADGVGSISLIALILKNCLNQRDRINKLEYEISNLTAAKLENK